MFAEKFFLVPSLYAEQRRDFVKNCASLNLEIADETYSIDTIGSTLLANRKLRYASSLVVVLVRARVESEINERVELYR